MAGDLIRLKLKFLAVQTGVVAAAFLIMSLVVGVYSVRKNLEETNHRLDKTMGLLTDQLKSNELPSSAALTVNDFAVTIVDGESGNLLVDRKTSFPDQTEDLLWQSYKAKLIYQMQKQKQGTVFYPEQSPGQWWEKKHLIRFSNIPELGWIIALESTMEPDIVLFAKPYTASNILLFLLILAGCGGFFWWFLTRNFNLMSKTIAETVEKDMLSLAGDNGWDVKHEPLPKSLPPASSETPPSDFLDQALIRFPTQQSQQPPSQPILSQPSFQKPPAAEPKPATVQQETPKPEPRPVSQPKSEEPGIHVGHIKSDILKKMIRELRNP